MLCLLLACADTALPDRRKAGGVAVAVDDLPVPDALPPVPPADTPLPPVREQRMQMHHTANILQQQGIDVSHYQGRIDWDRVARTGDVAFVYVKATEGAGYVDDCYLRNLYGARRAGIPVGVYHFFSPSASALVQLENFRTNVDPRQQDRADQRAERGGRVHAGPFGHPSGGEGLPEGGTHRRARQG